MRTQGWKRLKGDQQKRAADLGPDEVVGLLATGGVQGGAEVAWAGAKMSGKWVTCEVLSHLEIMPFCPTLTGSGVPVSALGAGWVWGRPAYPGSSHLG